MQSSPKTAPKPVSAPMDIAAIKAEMDHRTQNMFAMINSMVRLTGRHETEVKVAMSKLSERIHALSTAQAIIHLMEDAGSVSISDVIGRALQPYKDGHNIEVAAGCATLNSQQITPLSLIFHELAANALVFGAFADPDGRLDVRGHHEGGMMQISWRETCGTQPKRDTGSGFGNCLIERAAGQLGGGCARDLTPTGMHVDLHFPLPA